MTDRFESTETPAPEAPAVSYRQKLKRPDYLRIAVVVGAGLALLISAAVTLGASPAPSSDATPTQPNAGPAFGAGHGFGRGGPFGRAVGFGQITIAAIDGSNISLKTADGWSRTITITTATTLSKGGQKIAAGDLKVGDVVRFRETRNSDGSFSITALDVVLPRVAGSVTALSDTGFTIRERGGASRTITVNGSTVYRLDATNSGSRADVKVGSDVVVEGDPAADGSITATAVHVVLPVVAGQVTAKTGSTITLRRFDGTTITIDVGSATVFRVRGVTNATLSDIAIGMIVVAEGTHNADGSLQAVAVEGGKPGLRAFRPFGRFGPSGPLASPVPGSSG